MNRAIVLLILMVAVTVLSCTKKEEFNGTLYDKPASPFCLRTWEGGKERDICLRDLKGKVVLLFFGYTHCPDVCPTALGVLAKTFKKLSPEERNRVKVLFISVDPERDTPEIAQKYASYFNPSFIGATGTLKELKEVAKGYMAFFGKSGEGKEDYLVDHSGFIYLIDQEGVLKLIYSSSKQKPDLIAEDIRRLL